jgi:hypothetical protein
MLLEPRFFLSHLTEDIGNIYIVYTVARTTIALDATKSLNQAPC